LKNKAAIKLFINKPCHESWEGMARQDAGKFCMDCKKVVVDFTAMSDTDLSNYLKINKDTCGRFYEDQLNRKIVPLKSYPHSWWYKMPRIAAGVFTFFTLKSVTATPVKKQNETTQLPAQKQLVKPEYLADTATISGRVIDKDGTPLTNAEILIDGIIVSKTDAGGNFNFTQKITSLTKSVTLQFHYPGLNNTIRNYHPAMGSAAFNITLLPPSEGRRIIMGGISDVEEEINLQHLKFRYSNSDPMTDDNKAVLSSLAALLRNNPGVSINVIGSAQDVKGLQQTKKISKHLKNYLVEMEGIDESRLNIKEVPFSASLNKAIEFEICSKD
jgi:hypothetical protein